MMLFFLCLAPYMTFDSNNFQINDLAPDTDNSGALTNLLNGLEGNKEYLDMIASYMIYVHLLNSFCCCRMEGSWNKSISNSYVYIYTQINENECVMNEEKMNCEEEKRIMKHAESLGLSFNVEDAERFRISIYILKEIAKDDVEIMDKLGVGEVDVGGSTEVICNFPRLSSLLSLRKEPLTKLYRSCVCGNPIRFAHTNLLTQELRDSFWFVIHLESHFKEFDERHGKHTFNEICDRLIFNFERPLVTEFLERITDPEVAALAELYIEKYEETEDEFGSFDDADEEKKKVFLSVIYNKMMSIIGWVTG